VTANLGTGFVFHRDDSVIILTNRHVALPGNAAQLVFKDGITAGAEVVNSSLDHDLAVLQPSGVRLANYESLERGDSADLAIGDEVMTIGHPIGESRHISIGFYTGRFTNEEGRTLLRLSMSVDPGNSGGPLLNRQGSVVGIVTLKHSTASNIAYAIPIEKAHNLDINP
jgi:S1-C subfamily serine protease